MEPIHSDHVSLLAAHIALLVLRTQTSAASAGLLYIIPPRTQGITAQDAAVVLAALSKPVKLEARIAHGVILAAHGPVTGDLRVRHSQELESSIALWEPPIRRRTQLDPSVATLLIRNQVNPGDALRIPFEALAAWMRDYSMPSSLGGIWVDLPPGVCGIIEVSEPPHFEGTIHIANDI